MKKRSSSEITHDRDATPLQRPTPAREFHELWFALSKSKWRSVVFVPADTGSAVAAATALAEVGRQLHELPVTLFIMANPTDYWPAMQMVLAASSSSDEQDAGGADERPQPAPPAGNAQGAFDYASAVRVTSQAMERRGPGRLTGKVIVAIQPVIVEPLGLAVTQAADAVVLLMEVGATRLASAKRTIELIGRERIAGCVLSSSAARRKT